MNTKLQELNEKIEKLEDTIFMLEMIDHWTHEDFVLSDKYNKELRQLKDLVLEELSKVNK